MAPCRKAFCQGLAIALLALLVIACIAGVVIHQSTSSEGTQNMTTTTTSTATTTTSTATQNPSLTNNGSALIFPLKTSPVSEYPMYTEVFGVAVFGHSSISDAKFQHVASVLAEWLDNDEDGCADIPLVVSKVTFHTCL